ncbi:hypothetical protein T4B_1258 [Trichinella pseudospiralis]|uniref:Secreted protein n=2 Tax=Trichinella pseudospiralis TaxID=6337 RepID=A0A0V1FL33_TRIPS|nr:hypothetical protein T4E_2804 [Trichinella pseudospiralis]KRY65336.1 hypothetical protein T4A_12328 [Trichinella pseudospiralis]KRY86652.1 hypothetical protein T4D_4767 [Trichinella pseudospiralis]KRZ15260.1 hypothetical protein T4B_1258 [Trichinella pseudospiralis]
MLHMFFMFFLHTLHLLCEPLRTGVIDAVKTYIKEMRHPDHWCLLLLAYYHQMWQWVPLYLAMSPPGKKYN